MSGESLVPVRLYWADGRVEDLKQRLELADHAAIIRNTEGLHVHFVFSGQLDADGFAVFEEQADD